MTEPLVFVYADESCLGNQFRGKARPGGAGGLIELYDPERGWVRRDFWLSEPDTTNNRMAIASASHTLQSLAEPTRVVFTTDSRYLVDGMTQWVHGWAARGWKRKGGEIENLEMWKDLLRTAKTHQVQWRWVKGHAGHAQNEYANFLATRAAAAQTQSGGLVDSNFADWLAEEQRKERCMSFFPAPPHGFDFRPARALPRV